MRESPTGLDPEGPRFLPRRILSLRGVLDVFSSGRRGNLYRLLHPAKRGFAMTDGFAMTTLKIPITITTSKNLYFAIANTHI